MVRRRNLRKREQDFSGDFPIALDIPVRGSKHVSGHREDASSGLRIVLDPEVEHLFRFVRDFEPPQS